jgi:hypothetical protein
MTTFKATSPVILDSTIIQGRLRLYYKGTLLNPSDTIEVDTSQSDVPLLVNPPSGGGYTLQGSTVGSTPVPWLEIEGGGIVGDFPTPSANTRQWTFTISPTPNSPLLPSVEGFDPIMLIKKVGS